MKRGILIGLMFAVIGACAIGSGSAAAAWYNRYEDSVAHLRAGTLTAESASAPTAEITTATITRLNIGSTAVSATAAEINLTDGLTVLNGGSKTVANATTAAITVSGLLPGGTYYVGLSWESASADPGKCTWAVTTNTLTVTTANATTGTVHAVVIGK